MSSIELALIQHSFKGDKQSTIDFTLSQIAKAAKNGANLVALQELHTSEYFCQREDTRFFQYAESFEREVAIFSKVARQHKIVLVTSLFEKRAKGLYHNTAVVFERDGNIAGIYRKAHIPDDPSFYEKFYFTPGDGDFAAIRTSLGKIGVLICSDQWFPESARLMALGGADILIYPTAIGWDLGDSKKEQENQLNAWLGVQRGHAIANGIFVCAINRCGIECESEPESFESSKSKSDLAKNLRDSRKSYESKIKFWGHSFIYGPQGEEIAMAGENSDEILRATIDLNRIAQVRNIWPFLRDRRIECYHNLTKRFID